MKVRAGTPADAARAIDIWRAAVDATHGVLSADDRRAIDIIVSDQFLPHAPLWLAVDEADRPTGFLHVADGHIEALFVDPAAHGQGYGTALIEQAQALFSTLTVDASEQASNALPFYEARGFVRTGRSERDSDGRPYPIVHLRRAAPLAKDAASPDMQ
jgi:putative acetyltransferase